MYTNRFVLYYSTTKKPCKILKILIYSMTFYALFCFLLTLFIAFERLKYLSVIFFLICDMIDSEIISGLYFLGTKQPVSVLW